MLSNFAPPRHLSVNRGGESVIYDKYPIFLFSKFCRLRSGVSLAALGAFALLRTEVFSSLRVPYGRRGAHEKFL
jgi:hypothetical protein